MFELVDNLLDQIITVSKESESPYASMKYAGQKAKLFMTQQFEKLKENL